MGVRKGESVTIVEERGIWPWIGIAQQRERCAQSLRGMVILLCVVEERVIVIQPEITWVNNVHIAMLHVTLWWWRVEGVCWTM